jgi:hypothetical protein
MIPGFDKNNIEFRKRIDRNIGSFQLKEIHDFFIMPSS